MKANRVRTQEKFDYAVVAALTLLEKERHVRERATVDKIRKPISGLTSGFKIPRPRPEHLKPVDFPSLNS